MQEPTIDKDMNRDELKTKRKLVFRQICKNPENTSLAIEIRLIDDQVANLVERRLSKRTGSTKSAL